MKWNTREKYSMFIMENEDDKNTIEIIEEVCKLMYDTFQIYANIKWAVLYSTLYNQKNSETLLEKYL